MQHSLFGCKVNKFYLNKRLGYFQQRGFDDPTSHLVATCVVTDRAKSKWLRAVKHMLRDGQHVYLTGCGAFEKGEAMDYASFFSIYPSLRRWQSQLTLLGEDPEQQTDLGAIGEYELNKEITHQESNILARTNMFTKKFIVIQSGCDTFCTFCLTIYKRGSTRNRSLEDIIEEIRLFVDQGGKEIVITGVNLAAWGASHTRKVDENKFSLLLEAILRRTAIERIRISSLGPEFLDDHFFDLATDTRILPHFHFSLQHFNSQVLQLMNRNYNRDILDNVLARTRTLERPDKKYISIGGDLIVGFPGESQQAFDELVDAVKTYRITKMHAFPFSPHQKGETVPAAKLPLQVSTSVKKERMQTLLSVGDSIREHFIQENTTMKRPVLLEQKKDANGHASWYGWTPNYIQRNVVGDYARGDIVVC